MREKGFDVIAVADTPALRSCSDEELFQRALSEDRWVVIENIKDLRKLLVTAEEGGELAARLLFTNARTFPRSRHDLGPLTSALEEWLTTGHKDVVGNEDWLVPSM